MALIKCIECGHKISDKATACPNCGYPISKELAVAEEDTTEENTNIKMINGVRVDMGIVAQMLVDKEKIKAISYFHRLTGVDIHEAFDIVSALDTTAIIDIANANTHNNSDEVRCPHCGSTQIQVVPRKWSIMTGLLTNKVDRVCMNCKHKF